MALGSSFASGPDIPDVVDGRCARSSRNYAHVVAEKLRLQLTDVTCAGATTDNIAGVPQSTHPPQITAVTGDTKYVTVTVGGDDVSYSASTLECSADGRRGTSCLGNGVDPSVIATEMSGVEEKLIAMLRAIESGAPRAKVVLVTYPSVLPASGKPCPPSVPMLPEDEKFIARMGAQLQAHFKAAAKAAKVEFVDAYAASEGHDACARERTRWVEGSAPASPAFPYHPNARGMAAEATLVAERLESTS